jgi:predicted RNA polymerase sigma factor
MTDAISTPPESTRAAEAAVEASAAASVEAEQPRVDPMSTVSRDIAEVPSVEIISTAALHLMSAAAVNLGLAEDLPEHRDLDEARSLIDALAGLLDAAAPSLGHHHAAPLRDGLRSLQLAFKEASTIPDEPGTGPGEKYTGEVHPTATHR